MTSPGLLVHLDHVLAKSFSTRKSITEHDITYPKYCTVLCNPTKCDRHYQFLEKSRTWDSFEKISVVPHLAKGSTSTPVESWVILQEINSKVGEGEFVNDVNLEAVGEETLAEELVGHAELKDNHGQVETLAEDEGKEVDIEPVDTQVTNIVDHKQKRTLTCCECFWCSTSPAVLSCHAHPQLAC